MAPEHFFLSFYTISTVMYRKQCCFFVFLLLAIASGGAEGQVSVTSMTAGIQPSNGKTRTQGN